MTLFATKNSFGLFMRIVVLLMLAGFASACTIGVICGEVTTNGRPMLWKNRDVSNSDQEYAFIDVEPFPFVSNVYNGETHRAWAGINQAGFGIINSDVYNNGDNSLAGPDDGYIMRWALQNCETVDDFQAYLDSTNTVVRSSCHNYACIDAYGGAVMFEVSNESYVRFDAVEEGGYVIRANFAMSGDMGGHLKGLTRYTQAQAVIDRQANINYRFVLDSMASSIATPTFSPYPLPFDDPSSSMPRGYVNTYRSISRESTTSSTIMVGRKVGEITIAYPMMWATFAQPLIGMPFPLWPHANGVDVALNGASYSTICRQAQKFFASAYDLPNSEYLNTFKVHEIQDYFNLEKIEMFSQVTDRLENVIDDVHTVEYLRAFQDSITHYVENSYSFGISLLIKEDKTELPRKLDIKPCPNPFNATVRITLDPPQPYADIRIFDLSGRQVDIIQNGREPIKDLVWVPENSPSGIYMLRVISLDYGVQSKRLLYVK